MAFTFQVNGTDYDYLGDINWQDQLDQSGLDGYSPALRWRRLTARANIMPMADYAALKSLEGSIVSITTTNYHDRNGAYVTYYGATLDSITGKHDSINEAEVICEFMVRI